MLQTIFRRVTRSPSRRPLRQLRRSLLALPNELAEPLRLQVVDCYSLREIAEHLGISAEEASFRLRCARAKVHGVAID